LNIPSHASFGRFLQHNLPSVLLSKTGAHCCPTRSRSLPDSSDSHEVHPTVTSSSFCAPSYCFSHPCSSEPPRKLEARVIGRLSQGAIGQSFVPFPLIRLFVLWCSHFSQAVWLVGLLSELYIARTTYTSFPLISVVARRIAL